MTAWVCGWPRAGCTKASSSGRRRRSPNVALEHALLNALVLGLPWQRVGSQGAITVI
jgi:hypothetical protein